MLFYVPLIRNVHLLASLPLPAEQDKISEFELKLMDIDSDHLGIPDTEYTAKITMPAGEV